MTRLQPLLELLELVPSAGRLRVLEAIREAGELAPIDVYRRDAAPSLGMAAYHVRELCKAGLIVLIRTEPRRGTVAHFYAPTSAGLRLLELVDRIADVLDAADLEETPA